MYYATVDDGSCLIGGCTDSRLPNFDPFATHADGSCFALGGCTDAAAANFRFAANLDDGSCIYTGCADSTMLNYEPRATYAGPCVPRTKGCTFPGAINYWARANDDDGSCMIPGCTDSLAPNFSPYATFDNGECAHYITGCSDPMAVNFRPLAIVDDGSCLRVAPPPSAPSPPPLPPYPPAAPCDGFDLSVAPESDSLFLLTVAPRVWVPGRRVAASVLREGLTLAFRKGPATLIRRTDSEILLEMQDAAGDELLFFNVTKLPAFAWPIEADISIGCAWAPPSPQPQPPALPARPPPPPSAPPVIHTMELHVLLSDLNSSVNMSQVVEGMLAACEAETAGAVLDFHALVEQDANFTFARSGSWTAAELAALEAGVRKVSCAEALAAGGSCSATLVDGSPSRRLEEEEAPTNSQSAGTSAWPRSAMLEHSPLLVRRVSGRHLSEVSTAVILVSTVGLVPPTGLGPALYPDLVEEQRNARTSVTMRVSETPSFLVGGNTVLLFAVRTALTRAGLGEALDVDSVVVDRLVLPPAPPPSPPLPPAPPHGVRGCNDPAALNYESDVTIPDRPACRYRATARTGCMAPRATNYDAAARRDDGSCTFVLVGCKNSTAVNYAPDATHGEPSLCLFLDATRKDGCIIPSAINYDSYATVDDGSCRFSTRGCTNPLSLNWAPDADADDGSCVARVSGCTAPRAANYDSAANFDDGSCHNLSPPPSPPPPAAPPPPSPPVPPPSPPAPPLSPSPSPPPFCWWNLQLESCLGLSVDPVAKASSECSRRCCNDPQCTVWQWTDSTLSAVAGVCARGMPGTCNTRTWVVTDGGRRSSGPSPPYAPNAIPNAMAATQRLAQPVTPLALAILITVAVAVLCLLSVATFVLCRRRRSKVQAKAALPSHPTTRLKAGMIITGAKPPVGSQAAQFTRLRPFASRAPMPLQPPSEPVQVPPLIGLLASTGRPHHDAAGQPSPLSASLCRRRNVTRSEAELSISASSSPASSLTASLQVSPHRTEPEQNQLLSPSASAPATPFRSLSAIRSERPDDGLPLRVHDVDRSDDEIFALPSPQREVSLGTLQIAATRQPSQGTTQTSTPEAAIRDHEAEAEASANKTAGGEASALPASRGKGKTKQGKKVKA